MSATVSVAIPPAENCVASTERVSCTIVCEADSVFSVVEDSVGIVIVEEVLGAMSGMSDHRLSSLTVVVRSGLRSDVIFSDV